MTPKQLKRHRRSLQEFGEYVVVGMGRPERREAMKQYIVGLLLEGERKSMAPMAERMAERGDAEGMRQRLQQAVAVARWSDQELYRRIAAKLHSALPGLRALVLDDTGFAKKGLHSVGVARQYSGTLGRTDNCQVATSLHLAGEGHSGCIGMRLYLPEQWVEDDERRAQTGIPDDVAFKTKWQLGLDLLDLAIEWGLGEYPVLADAGYGDSTEFRAELRQRGLHYVVAIQGTQSVWSPNSRPSKKRYAGRGRPTTRYRDDRHPPQQVHELLEQLSFRKLGWRQGSKGRQTARFAFARVRNAHGWQRSEAPGDEEWLVVEQTNQEARPYKYYLSSLPASTTRKELVTLIKLRWRIERDYQEMKGELGLDHFEGRGWIGFHHHAALCAAAHAFLATQRALFPPEPKSVDARRPPARASAGAAAPAG